MSSVVNTSRARPAPRRNLAVAAGVTVLIIGLSMRVPIISVSPILASIQAHYGLSSVSAGLLTTLPVLCFGALAPVSPLLQRRFGIERTILAMMLLICGGMLLRTVAGSAGLFTGTVALGAAIAVSNVLIPGLIKRDWSHAAGPLMSVYSMSMSLGPALAAVLTVPLSGVLGGDVRLTLLAWLFLPALAWMLLRLLSAATVPASAPPDGAAAPTGGLARDRLAWQVSFYLGLQSLLFYSISAWLPSLLQEAGLSEVSAGAGFSVFNLVSLLGATAAPLLAVRLRSQGGLAAIGAALWAAGLLGLLAGPAGGWWLFASLCGLGSGLSFSLALTLLVLRSRDAGQAARLSGMAQAIGYLLAATGPLVAGWLRETGGDFTAPLLFLLLAVPFLAVAGLLAGRPLYVLAAAGTPAEPGPP